jgi:hypothetical protein
MGRCPVPSWIRVIAFLSLAGVVGAAAIPEPAVVFNRDIRPILSDACFPCHGFDAAKRKGDLRLDTPEGIFSTRDGRQAVKPGDPEASELWARVTTRDPKKVMPPPESSKQLKPEQTLLLRRWIESGATYQQHWAFVPPSRPELPQAGTPQWEKNPVDRFVLATLKSQGLNPSAEAPKESLIRRVTLDLTGLPPTVREVEAFVADESAEAYDHLVDRLLDSPRYGEHMARYWLDVARYGDTHGLHLDNERSMWPYRDWVVEAFNRNLPFDQFTIWQLAGDLLPNPTREQLVASGYNRCNVSTSEGGAIDEEFQVRYAVDRVEATSTAWMGLTMGCAVCHDHKLDPITQKEFFQVFSIFNNIAENAMDGNAPLPPPSLPLPTPEQEQQLKEADQAIADLEKRAKDLIAVLRYEDPATITNPPLPQPTDWVWVEDQFPDKAEKHFGGANQPDQWVARAEGPVLSGERALLRFGKGLHQAYFIKAPEPPLLGLNQKLFAYVYLDPADPPKSVMLQFHFEDWEHRAVWGDPDAIPYGTKDTPGRRHLGPLPETGKWARLEVAAEAIGLKAGTKVTGLSFAQFDGRAYWDKAGLVQPNDPALNPVQSYAAWEKIERGLGDRSKAPQPIKELLKKEPAKLEEAEQQKLKDHYLLAIYEDPGAGLKPLRAELKAVRDQRAAVDKKVVGTMISKELEKPRRSWVLIRGQYDKHGEEVGPGVPSFLPPLPAGDTTNRLAFARWLVDPNHPLTARVTVNRFWQQFFGTGIVKTSEDFGNKGDWPSHPELLDWLATEFIRSGWDVKHLARLLVTSASYRQDSRVSAALLARDPENRLLGRGPRYRLDGEVIRDSALALSGLLVPAMGGRGVRPYQPPGIWEAVGYTTSDTAKYTQDHGDALYRRSLYLFWKRTAPPPSMITFDAPSREQCRARRERTNTPLQSLLTMNDVQFFEAARQLGYRMLREGGNNDSERLRYGFRLTTARLPSEKELAVLSSNLSAQRSRYAENPAGAKQLISVGESPVPTDVPAEDLAAYTLVANVLLNLDDVLTKN